MALQAENYIPALMYGGIVNSANDIALTQNYIMVGDSNGLAVGVAISGDASIVASGAITVTGASAAFNVGTNVTMTKEVNHTISVSASTTTNTAGATLSVVAAAGVGTGAGGDTSVTGGASGAGATGNGGAANVTGGAALSTNGNGGNVVLTGGAKAGSGFDGGVMIRSMVRGKKQIVATAKTTSATLTAAELMKGIVTVNQGGAGTSALQLPDGTAMDTGFPGFTTEDSFDVSFINISTVDAEDASVTTNTGWTLVGAMDFEAYSAAYKRSSGILRLRKTGTATWTAYRIA